jgi:hypothetical protein
MTHSGQQFVAASGQNNEFIAFASDDNLRILCAADEIFMDGTFDVVPAIFFQLYTLHCRHNGFMLPLVYVLMENKSTPLYEGVFAALNLKATHLGLQLNPSTIVTDFETGVIPAIRNQFPGALHRGCHFHFSQAVWRQVQTLGLVNDYRNDPAVAEHVRLLMALPFAPRNIVRNVFNQLQQSAPPQMAPLLAYYDNQWFRNVSTRLWNVFGIDDRTTNEVEGWHLRFNNIVRKHHPNLWQLVSALQDEHASVDISIQQLNVGQQLARPSRKYAAIQKKISSLRERFQGRRGNRQSIDVMTYLRGVAHNLMKRH